MNAASPDEAGEVRRAGVMLRDASAGLILALVTFAYSLSFGALIFAGRLSEFAAAGVAAATLSAGLASLVLSRLSSFPRALGGPDTPVVAVAAALAAGVAAATPAEATAMQTLANVAAALVLSTAATAALLLSAGAYGLASFVRFTPFPVVAGFLAASGWFLVVGAASLASGLSGQALWARLAEGGPPPTVLAALIFGAAIAAARVLSGSSLAAPLMVFGAGGAIVAAGPLGLVPPDLLREAGWLLPSTPAGGPALPIAAFVEVAPDPQVLLIFAPEILAVAGVAAIAILLNAAGLEAHARADLEADREFIASGAANAALLPLGGIASNLSLNRSALNTDLGARGRAAGGLAGLVCCALAFAGPWAGALAPTPILAGMVLYMGVGMLRRWLWDAARRFTFSEYLLVLAIFALIVRYGYLAGVTLGLVAACVSFALACARAPFVRQALT
ncbi:MAG: SulP family inorganic anion transporter, partial [Pseudomonadota bacterium]